MNITANSAEQLLRDLVSIASPSCHEAEASAFLVDWMRAQGYDRAYVDDAGNAVGIIGDGRVKSRCSGISTPLPVSRRCAARAGACTAGAQ